MWCSRALLALILCLTTSGAWGAIAEVASMKASGSYTNAASSTAVAYPNNVTAGQLLIAGGCNWNTATQSMAVTGAPNTWTVVQGADLSGSGGVYKAWIGYSIAQSSGAYTPTIDPAGTGNYGSYAVDAFSGVDTGTPLSVNGGSTSATSTTQSDAITTSTANELIIGVMCNSNGGEGTITITPNASYTQIGEDEDVADTNFSLVYRIATSATSYTVSWTLGSSQAGNAQTLSFDEAAAAAAACRRMLMGVGC